MDRIHPMLHGQVHDAGNVEIRPDRLAGMADLIRLVGLEAVQREAVFMRIDRHRPHAQLMRAAKDANRDLATVRGEEFCDLCHKTQENLMRVAITKPCRQSFPETVHLGYSQRRIWQND
jgi:hypothetical protein